MLVGCRPRDAWWLVLFGAVSGTLLIQVVFGSSAHGAVASHHDHADHHLHMPLHVLTLTSNSSEYEYGLRMFETSFNRTKDIDTPMELEVVHITPDKFEELGWRVKLLYTVKSLRRLPQHQLVLWADSKDIVWLPCGRDLRKAFKDFDHDIVIGSCEFQYPDGYKEELFPDVPILKPEIPFPNQEAKDFYASNKHINAGIIVGRAGALLHYLGGIFLRYNIVDKEDFNDQAFWANMYLAQFYDDPVSAGRHPTIAIDSGYMVAIQGVRDLTPVGDTGYWASDWSRFTACMIHAPGGAENYETLFEEYNTTWSKSFDHKAAAAEPL